MMTVSRKRWEYVRYGEEGVKKHAHDAAHEVGTKTYPLLWDHKESNSRGTTWNPAFLSKICQFFAAAGISREPRTLCSVQKSSKALEVRDFSDR